MNCKITENYFKEKARMGKYDAKTQMCRIPCENCPLSCYNNSRNLLCGQFEKEYPEDAIAIVQKWSDEHLQKTYQDDFFEKFPNAQKDPDGTPKCCCDNIYSKARSGCSNDGKDRCYKCWNEVMPV